MTTTTINLIKYKRQQSYGTKYTNAAGFESNFFLGFHDLNLKKKIYPANHHDWNVYFVITLFCLSMFDVSLIDDHFTLPYHHQMN
ncbi:hypothetical protein DERF_002008 [Dermatophagoides farinae]|uniref:Uncharacterized protein n=1 Tax=Dermatophagoides farinae TaxID=6954 RepID=A0A922IAQ1_DERFA|nr:hypothetical protein DERF_002008 [Dermatophagoides farinae]